jgi:hypothetical protein
MTSSTALANDIDLKVERKSYLQSIIYHERVQSAINALELEESKINDINLKIQESKLIENAEE